MDTEARRDKAWLPCSRRMSKTTITGEITAIDASPLPEAGEPKKFGRTNLRFDANRRLYASVSWGFRKLI